MVVSGHKALRSVSAFIPEGLSQLFFKLENILRTKMEMENSSLLLALTFYLCLFFCLLISRHITTGKEVKFLSSLPVIGLGKGRFAWTKATFLSIFKTKSWAFEGYRKVEVVPYAPCFRLAHQISTPNSTSLTSFLVLTVVQWLLSLLGFLGKYTVLQRV
jgi:hypothetical protein